ncbi:MAG: bifunctional (p)ppGpp synthetase/guanosine-3',5'-bis(diphosphate) 3'-pyrophosphohydrolase [Phycisphaerales bacterium]|nr:bifunctional (p)ppGpp synthetase/guanosine-3',5'-bis(diphosphate) 3'-pyrophosphohydrolase [Phycisphaerales bacterium]MCB9835177.1 bifunctional (p)ppGpp synthetase/guanosine-3',5'-bis(diphosphate) 3'-pyrophosphohydrolase [Phycisphaera sp.]
MTDRTPSPQADALWQSACAFAARSHAGQVRKDGLTPYFSHPVRVAFTLRQIFGCDDPVALTAAILHDTIEDTPADYDDIADRFGGEIAGIVAALTKNMILPEHEREPEYDARLAQADWRARLIKLADVYDNLCDMHTSSARDAALAAQRHLARCRRAIKLAEPDRAHHPEVANAIDCLNDRLAQAQGS